MAKVRLIFINLLLISIFIGCGNSSFESKNSSSGTQTYNLTAVDDPIVGAKVTASNCSNFIDNKNGSYILTGCSEKPSNIIISGGFIDIDGNGVQDTNESSLEFPYILNTALFSSNDNFVITPLTTIVSSLPAGTSLKDFASKFGLSIEDLFSDLSKKYGKNSTKHQILQNINLIFTQAANAGIADDENPQNTIDFLNDYAKIIQDTPKDSNPLQVLTNAKDKFTSTANIAKYKKKYGALQFTGFVVDTKKTTSFAQLLDNKNM